MKLSKPGSFWVSLWRPEVPSPTPAPHDERSLSLVPTMKLQGGEWLPYDGLSGTLILAPIGTVTDHHAGQEHFRTGTSVVSPYWNENTFYLG